MKNTPLATAIVTQKILSLLEKEWKPIQYWWEKCADTYELYKTYLAVGEEHPRVTIGICPKCDVQFPIDSRARKNSCHCIFGCRDQNKRERDRENKKLQRQRERLDTIPPVITSFQPNSRSSHEESPPSLNDPLFWKEINSLKLTTITTSVILLISAIHPGLTADHAKLCGIIAFMSVGMKLGDQVPDWLSNIDENALIGVINEIADG